MVNIVVVDSGVPFSVGPFGLQLHRMCHSIPEAQALVIDTEYVFRRWIGTLWLRAIIVAAARSE